MKKMLALLLCLLLPLSALAAPVRDVRQSVLSDAELATMRSWLDENVREALPVEYENDIYVGAYVYSCVEDGGCYVLECDVYLEAGDDTNPIDAPEDAVQWLCGATVCVTRDGSGYGMVSCETTPYYSAMEYRTVHNDQYGYEMNVPETYVQRDDGFDYSCYEEDELVSGVRYRCEDAGDYDLAGYAALLTGESEDDMTVTMKEDVGLATAQAAGLYIAVYEGNGVFYSLTVTYPEDREAEFSLYAEFMRNSLVVAGESNG